MIGWLINCVYTYGNRRTAESDCMEKNKSTMKPARRHSCGHTIRCCLILSQPMGSASLPLSAMGSQVHHLTQNLPLES